jgi:hypothetical protein
MLALLCGKWNALREVERDLFRLWVSLQEINILILRRSSDYNPSYTHVFPKPIAHITSHLTLSLGDEIDSRSDLASTARAGNQHETRGKGRKDSSL